MDSDCGTTIEAFLAALMEAREEQRKAAVEAAMQVLRSPFLRTEPLLTLRQLAKHYGVDVTTVWRWKVPAVEWRGAKKYQVTECDRYLSSPAFAGRRAELRDQRQAAAKARKNAGGAK
jgi:uncharacterized protein YjcR